MEVKENFSPFFLGHLLRIVLNVSKKKINKINVSKTFPSL